MPRNRLSHLVLASLLLLLGVSTAWADIPPRPRVAPPVMQTHPIKVQIDDKNELSVIRIPRAFLPPDKQPQASAPLLERFNSSRSIIAALALSLGVVGMLFLRKQRIAGVAALVIATSVLTGVTVECWANAPAAGPDRFFRLEYPTMLEGNIVIKIAEDGERIDLILGTKTTTPPKTAPNAPDAPIK